MAARGKATTALGARFTVGQRILNYTIVGVSESSKAPFSYRVRDERCGCERELHACAHYEGFSGQKRMCSCLTSIYVRRQPEGYIYWDWFMPSGRRVCVSEHRIAMERLLGRELVAGEEVHHKNGNRYDNRPENLELWNKSQPSGQRPEDKIVWAKEILSLYEPSALTRELTDGC
jgi:hypothetical protein